MSNLATVAVSRDAQATVVIGLPTISSFQALLHPWTPEPMLLGYLTDPTRGRQLLAIEQRDANVTGFVLEPLGEVRDQLLVVSTAFPTGNALHFWRLNGATATAQPTPGPTGELGATLGRLAPDHSPLANTSWKLEALGTPYQRLAANTEITISFEGAEHVAQGSAGCNSYGARYAVSDSMLSFTELASTAMACDIPGVMDQEQRFQQALLAVERYRLEGDRLEFVYAGNNVLRWVAVK
jgi:heat shock protein HslJ